MNSEVEGIAARGRPKMGWREGIKNSLQDRNMSLEVGRVKALNRNEWRRIVNKKKQ